MPSPHWPYKERGVEGVHLSPVLCPWVGQMLQSPRQVPLLLERDWPRSAAADVIITRTIYRVHFVHARVLQSLLLVIKRDKRRDGSMLGLEPSCCPG